MQLHEVSDIYGSLRQLAKGAVYRRCFCFCCFQRRLEGLIVFKHGKRVLKHRKTAVTGLQRLLNTHFIYWQLTRVLFLVGEPGRGPGIPQVIHQSSVQVSFERSEEGEDHAV